jgi:DNA-binding NtrC family response regulator
MNRDNFRILILDDEDSFLLLMTRILTDEKYSVRGVNDPLKALAMLDSFSPNLLITDLRMPGMDGITFMEKAGKGRDIDFIVITAFATVETAVDAMKKGASDYITKPLQNPDQLRLAVKKIFERQSLIIENTVLKSALAGGIPSAGIIFAGMPQVMKAVQDVAPTDATILLLGETGTGKTLIAKVVHHISGRKGPFVDINCAAIPESLLESEMFGHERGAFTGALFQKKGRFEVADEGTILLDEVSEMNPLLQAKFLRVLQEKAFERVGSSNSLSTNARVIAATNRDLRQMTAEGKFREDLFYRLNVFPVLIPALRERAAYIEEIARYIIDNVTRRLGKGPKVLSSETLIRMKSYRWPGNIRELENVIERAVIVSSSRELDLSIQDGDSRNVINACGGDLMSLEREAIKKALAQADGHRKNAAQILGISLRSLQYKIKAYGLN